MTRPFCDQSDATAPNYVIVGFDQDMDFTIGRILDVAAWSIPGFVVDQVQELSAREVGITIRGEWQAGVTYWIYLDPDMFNTIGESLDPAGENKISTIGYLFGEPDSDSATTTDSTHIHVMFTEPVRKDDALGDPGNYVVTAVTAGASPVFVTDVIIPPGALTYGVYLVVSGMTNGATYSVVASNITDMAGNTKAVCTARDCTGIAALPEITEVRAISANRVDVVFSSRMAVNADINNAAKYSFDNGLMVLAVLGVERDTVQLATSDQVSGTKYTLTVMP